MKNKNNILILTSIFIILVGSFMPSISVLNENISFIKENGLTIIILLISMLMLLRINYKQLLYIPAFLSLALIIKFIIDNNEKVTEIKKSYGNYISFEYGIIVMIIGIILLIVLLSLDIFDIKALKSKLENIKLIKEKEKINKIKNKTKEEKTKDGKIRYKKLTVTCDNKKLIKVPIKQRISDFISKIRFKRFFKKKLSVSYYKETPKTSYSVPVIDIKRWTRSNICCSNCGATVSTNSEYCFLCDCKIKLSDRKKTS